MLDLGEHQIKARDLLRNGNILYGLVGTGKSRVAVAYYEKHEAPKPVIVITTAKKRDSHDWEREFAAIAVGTEQSYYGLLTVDSWNNITKYIDTKGAFFIFDEQRLVGSGAWVKAFQKIVKNNAHLSVDDQHDPNTWLLLTGTPGDSWMDYMAVFIANGFYKNKTQFLREHVLFEPFSKFPKIKGYLNEGKLEALRNHLLVEMPYKKHTIPHINWWDVEHDKEMMRTVVEKRWNPFLDQPIKDVAEMYRLMRRVVNGDESRLREIQKLQKMHPKLIVFYNFDYELAELRRLGETIPIGEWNGHKKMAIPRTDEWLYLVQYTSGAEGWNCIETDATAFYSLNYSWRITEQSKGRIDRLNTPFTDLYYYFLMSHSVIDASIRRALDTKQDFNERKDARKLLGTSDVSALFNLD